MQTEQFIHEVADKATGMVGDAAGMVTDPKTGLARLKKRTRPMSMIMLIAVAAVAYALGRRAGQHMR